MPALRTRREAKAVGLTTYFTGRPCTRGHVDVRRVSNKNCRTCALAFTNRWLSEGKRAVRGARDADRYAAQLGMSRAAGRAPGCVPGPFDLMGTIPVYAEARRLSRETGIRHEVDHIIPLSKGGTHTPDNLQVLTATENARKGGHYYD